MCDFVAVAAVAVAAPMMIRLHENKSIRKISFESMNSGSMRGHSTTHYRYDLFPFYSIRKIRVQFNFRVDLSPLIDEFLFSFHNRTHTANTSKGPVVLLHLRIRTFFDSLMEMHEFFIRFKNFYE